GRRSSIRDAARRRVCGLRRASSGAWSCHRGGGDAERDERPYGAAAPGELPRATTGVHGPSSCRYPIGIIATQSERQDRSQVARGGVRQPARGKKAMSDQGQVFGQFAVQNDEL